MPEVSLPEALTSGPSWRRRFRGRVRAIAVVAGLWLVAATIQAAHFMVTNRDNYLGQHDGWVTGSIPALRGRLVSMEGIPLAWSSRRFRLVYTVPDSPETVQQDLRAVQQRIDLAGTANWETAGRHAGATVVLRDDLSAETIANVADLATRNPRLRIASHFTRESVGATQQARATIGDTRVFGQTEVGISGWEKQYDARLRGREGRFRVMIDRTGAWIPQTWQEVAAPAPGPDVFVPVSARSTDP